MSEQEHDKNMKQVISHTAGAKSIGDLSDEDLDKVAGGQTVTITVNPVNDAPTFTITQRKKK